MRPTLIQYFHKHQGYASLKDLKRASFQTRDLSKLLEEGVLTKVKPGLYKLANLEFDPKVGMDKIDVCRAIPEAVICLASALEFHGLSTFAPPDVYVALPRSYKPPKIAFPPIRVFHFIEPYLTLGVEKHPTRYGPVKIFDAEKTICDMFRFRHKLGEDLVIEGLRTYLAKRKPDLDRLRRYSKKLRVASLLEPRVTTLLG